MEVDSKSPRCAARDEAIHNKNFFEGSMTNRTALSARQPESFSANFESMTGMSRWLMWLAVMSAIVLLFLVGFLYDPENKKGVVQFGLYVVIGGLGVALVIRGYFVVKFLDREMKLASEQVQILESVDDFDTFFTKADRSVFRSHIDNLYTISLSEPEFNQDNLIQILHDRLMSRNKVVDLFASILITLGLIGTIVGLIQMTTSMAGVIREGSDGLLLRLFQTEGGGGPMSALGTAFYTTLLGAVFGGVMLRVLTNVIDTNIMRYTAHLAELTEVHVLPYMRKLARERHRQEGDAAPRSPPQKEPAR